MRISTQIGLAMGLLGVSIAAVASHFISGIEHIREGRAAQAEALARTGAINASVAVAAAQCRHLETSAFLAAGDLAVFEAATALWRESFDQLMNAVDRLSDADNALDDHQAERVEAWQIAADLYGSGFERIAELTQNGDLRDPATLQSSFVAYDGAIRTLSLEASALSRKLNTAAARSGQEVWEELRDRQLTGTVLTLVILLLATAWCLHYPGALSRPIQALQRATDRVAHGEADVRCESKRNDEVGMLARGFDAMSRTIDERTQALEQTVATARAAVRAKNHFLANMSHELRTPMNGLLGMIDELARSDLTADQQQCIGIAQECSESLLTIVGDVLDLSKLQSETLSLECQAFSVRELGVGVHRLFRASCYSNQDLDIDLICDEGLPPRVLGDPVRLRQVLSNLTGNAVKFTTSGKIEIRILSLMKDVVGFSVRDTGIGIQADEHERIFEPFEQADNSSSRRFGGTGLGLAISRRLVTQMGGQLTVESKPGYGSTFRFALVLQEAPEVEEETLETLLVQSGLRPPEPAGDEVALAFEDELEAIARELDRAAREASRATALATSLPTPEPAATTDTPRAQNPEPEPEPPLSAVRVLIAEDNRVNQTIAKKILESAGATVAVADNGQIALDMLQAVSDGESGPAWDLVLMDCQMPVLDGFDATRQMRRSVALREIPVVAVTANAMEGDRERCLSAGMDDFVPKPVKRELLIQTIRRQLERRAAWI